MTQEARGPLAGLRVIEMAGLGPVPLAGLMLAEMGARVLRIERAGAALPLLPDNPEFDLDRHGRELLALDLKSNEGRATVARLAGGADCLIEGFRPGVMERLGLGPDDLMAANPRLVYGRMTGYGQDGPLAGRAGHDLNYLALAGVLSAIGRKGAPPAPPLNLVADYGGGTMFLLTGLLAALVQRSLSGKGEVVDASMVDGVSMLAAPYFGFMAAGFWQDRRGENLLDGGAPFYDVYETKDGGALAVACLEPQFFAEFSRLLPLESTFTDAQYDRAAWPAMRAAIAGRIGAKPRAEWEAVFAGSDACVSPVLSFAEAAGHQHNVARGVHGRMGTLTRPAPAPRFSGGPLPMAGPARRAGVDVLSSFGLSEDEIAALVRSGLAAG